MVNLVDNNEIPVINNIIGMNPTGTIDFNGTFKMNGPNSKIQDTSTIGHNNLVLSQTNQVVCTSVEKFTNDYNKFYDKIILILLISFFILLFVYIFF
jgi:hypothetical protein